MVSLTPDSPELDAPDEVELFPAVVPVLSAAVVPVDPGTVVTPGVLEKPDESAVGTWQAPSTASSISRGGLGLIGRSLARPGSVRLPR